MRQLRSLAERAGLGRPLAGLRRRLRRWGDPQARVLHARLETALRQSAPAIRRVADGAPAGRPDLRALFVCSFATVYGRKLEGALSLAARLAGFAPGFLELDYDPWGPRYHGLFGVREHRYFRRFQARIDGQPAAATLPGEAASVRDLLALGYRGVDVGRVALSNVLNRRKFSRFELSDAATRAEVAAELAAIRRNVHAAEALLDQAKPHTILLLEKGLSPAAEIVGVALARGIPVVQYAGAQTSDSYVLKRYRHATRHDHPFSLDASSWLQVCAQPWTEQRARELLGELESSYRSGSWFDRKFLHENKRIKTPDEVRRQLGLDPARKTAVVFSHVLWDATFFYGQGLFETYEDWLVETVRAAAANARINWVVKLHPDLVWKLRYEGHRGELRDLLALRSAVGSLPPHVKLVPPDTDISTYSFFGITDFCLTVRGTIGIEMACHGVPVLTAGSGRYSGLGFTEDSASPSEYLDKLARLPDGLAPSARGTELAGRFGDALFKRRPWRMRSFATLRQPIERTGDPLDTDLVPRVEGFAEYAAAEDTRRLVAWLASDAPDYLESEP